MLPNRHLIRSYWLWIRHLLKWISAKKSDNHLDSTLFNKLFEEIQFLSVIISSLWCIPTTSRPFFYLKYSWEAPTSFIAIKMLAQFWSIMPDLLVRGGWGTSPRRVWGCWTLSSGASSWCPGSGGRLGSGCLPPTQSSSRPSAASWSPSPPPRYLRGRWWPCSGSARYPSEPEFMGVLYSRKKGGK